MSSPTTGRQRGTASKAPRKTLRNPTDVGRSEKERRPRASSGATPRATTHKRSRSGATSALADEDGDDDDGFDSEHDRNVKKGRARFNENGFFPEGDKSMRYFGPGFTDLYSPSVSHQLIHTGLHNKMPPHDVLQRPFHPLHSVVTPSQFDLSVFTIPLTALEIPTV